MVYIIYILFTVLTTLFKGYFIQKTTDFTTVDTLSTKMPCTVSSIVQCNLQIDIYLHVAKVPKNTIETFL